MSTRKTIITDAGPTSRIVQRNDLDHRLQSDWDGNYHVFSDAVEKKEINDKTVLYRKNNWYRYSEVRNQTWEREKLSDFSDGNISGSELPFDLVCEDYMVLGYDVSNYSEGEEQATYRPIKNEDQEEIRNAFSNGKGTTVFFREPFSLL